MRNVRLGLGVTPPVRLAYASMAGVLFAGARLERVRIEMPATPQESKPDQEESMAAPDFDADAHIRAAAPMLGLDLDEERIAAVAPFLSLAAEMADILEAAPVPDGSLALAAVYDPAPALKS